MRKILLSVCLLVLTLCLVGCNTNEKSMLPKEMPKYFAFTLTFGFDGYYDSKTGLLKNGYNYDLDVECQTKLILDERELKEVYELLKSCGVDKVPNKITVSKDLVDPSYSIKISSLISGETINITIFGASHISVDEWCSYKDLGYAYNKILKEYIFSSEEYKALPENQNLYD